MSEFKRYKKINATQAGGMLGLHRHTVTKMMRDGTLPIGRVQYNDKKPSYIIYREWVEEFMEGKRK